MFYQQKNYTKIIKFQTNKNITYSWKLIFMKTYKTIFHGSEVLLMGTKHERIDDSRNFEPTNQEEYTVLSRFRPEAIFVELVPRKNISSKAKFNTDIAAINEYSEHNNVEIIKYDTELNKSYLWYSLNKPEGIDDKYDEETDSREKYRKILYNNYLEMFEDMYSQREEKSADLFIQKITQYNCVVIHCGLKHFNVYKEFFEFMALN